MGKNRRFSSKTSTPSGSSRKQKLQHTKGNGGRPVGIVKNKPGVGGGKKHIQQTQSRPTIPFQKDESILLVGEGDLSFARSLIEVYGCVHVVASVLEGEEKDLVEKYPAVGDEDGVKENLKVIRKEGKVEVSYGVDVRKKGFGMGRKGDKWARIVFNFPHVGGKSTDVNRQVRYNQELLVQFFKNAIPLLSLTTGSSILVTLFEGEPYTLWNIRDLARHSGLEVKRSFKFQAGAYKGYRHARTLGAVKGKDGQRGGWKGEERKARTYEFVRKGEGEKVGDGKKKKDSEESEEDVDVVDVDECWGKEGSFEKEVTDEGENENSKDRDE